jgi:hypothetical protein
MTKFLLPLALTFAASAVLACPGSMKNTDAKADNGQSVAALSAKSDKAAPADKKAVKPAEAKKPTT